MNPCTLVNRLHKISNQLRCNDPELIHFEPIPPEFSPTFGLFERYEFQSAYRDCLQALVVVDCCCCCCCHQQQQQPDSCTTSSTSATTTTQSHIVPTNTTTTTTSKGLLNYFSQLSNNLLPKRVMDNEEMKISCQFDGTVSRNGSRTTTTHNSNITKVTLRALPEPDLSMTLKTISKLVHLMDVEILQSQQSQSIAIKDVTNFLTDLYHSKCSNVVVATATTRTCTATATTTTSSCCYDCPENQDEVTTTTSDNDDDETITTTITTTATPTPPTMFHMRGGLRRLNIATRIHVKSQMQIDDFAHAISLHIPTLEYLSIHLLPRCTSIAQPNLSFDSLLLAISNTTTNNNNNNPPPIMNIKSNGVETNNNMFHSTEEFKSQTEDLDSCLVLTTTKGTRANLYNNNNRIKVCRIVLGYDHNPFGRPLIQPLTLKKLLTSCKQLRKLQLDNFGITNQHISIVTNLISQQRLALRELQFARNQFHYDNNNNNSTTTSSCTMLLKPQNDEWKHSRRLTTASLYGLLDAIESSNYKLKKVCLLTNEEIVQYKETISDEKYTTPTTTTTTGSANAEETTRTTIENLHSRYSTVAFTQHVESLIRGQKLLDIGTRLNQLNRKDLYQHTADHTMWLTAIKNASLGVQVIPKQQKQNNNNNNNYFTLEKFSNNPKSSSYYTGRTKIMEKEDPLALDVIYKLLRSNPVVILSSDMKNKKKVVVVTAGTKDSLVQVPPVISVVEYVGNTKKQRDDEKYEYSNSMYHSAVIGMETGRFLNLSNLSLKDVDATSESSNNNDDYCDSRSMSLHDFVVQHSTTLFTGSSNNALFDKPPDQNDLFSTNVSRLNNTSPAKSGSTYDHGLYNNDERITTTTGKSSSTLLGEVRLTTMVGALKRQQQQPSNLVVSAENRKLERSDPDSLIKKDGVGGGCCLNETVYIQGVMDMEHTFFPKTKLIMKEITTTTTNDSRDDYYTSWNNDDDDDDVDSLLLYKKCKRISRKCNC